MNDDPGSLLLRVLRPPANVPHLPNTVAAPANTRVAEGRKSSSSPTGTTAHARIGPRGHIRYIYAKQKCDSTVASLPAPHSKAGILKAKRRVRLIRPDANETLRRRASTREQRSRPWAASAKPRYGRLRATQTTPVPPPSHDGEASESSDAPNYAVFGPSTTTPLQIMRGRTAVRLDREAEVEAAEAAARAEKIRFARPKMALAASDTQSSSSRPQIASTLVSYRPGAQRREAFKAQEHRKTLAAARASNRAVFAFRLRRAVQRGREGIEALRALLPCGDAVNAAASPRNARGSPHCYRQTVKGMTALHWDVVMPHESVICLFASMSPLLFPYFIYCQITALNDPTSSEFHS
jgi:hypothetical protein